MVCRKAWTKPPVPLNYANIVASIAETEDKFWLNSEAFCYLINISVEHLRCFCAKYRTHLAEAGAGENGMPCFTFTSGTCYTLEYVMQATEQSLP